MLTERTPIERFIHLRIQSPRIKKAIEPLNIDSELLHTNLVRTFLDMGVFTVVPGQDQIVEQAMLAEIRRLRDRQLKTPIRRASRMRP